MPPVVFVGVNGKVVKCCHPFFKRSLLTSPDSCINNVAAIIAAVTVTGNMNISTAAPSNGERLAPAELCLNKPLMCVKIKGLAPPQRSRLIDPVIEAAPAVAR
jgi:hypothetical protein